MQFLLFLLTTVLCKDGPLIPFTGDLHYRVVSLPLPPSRTPVSRSTKRDLPNHRQDTQRLWLNTGLGQQGLAGGQVRHLVGLGLGREGAVGGPEVDEGLHGLELVGPQQVEVGGGQQEVAEAAVELLLQVEVVEGLDEVGVVQVGVDAEHLQEDGLADGHEVLGEAAAPAHIVAVGRVGDARQRLARAEGRVQRVRHAGRVRGEHLCVVDLARYPPLHEGHILEGRQLDGLISAV